MRAQHLVHLRMFLVELADNSHNDATPLRMGDKARNSVTPLSMNSMLMLVDVTGKPC